MLGLKRYEDYTLDLWTGEEKDFFCDLMIFFGKEIKKEDFDAKNILSLNNFKEISNLSTEKSLRHLAFIIDENFDSSGFFKTLKEVLSEKKLPKETKRISFLTKTVPLHDIIQKELSVHF